MASLIGTIPQCPANHAPPPRGPSNSFKPLRLRALFARRIFPSHSVTFSPTQRPRKSFSCNTYGSPRKCCKQKTYGRAKPFRCNTYKKQGEGVLLLLTRSVNQKPSKRLVSRTTPPWRSSQPTCPGPVGITLSPCLPYPLSPYPQSPCYHHPAAPNPHSFLPDRRSS